MKKTNRLLSLILAALILSASLASCAEDTTEDTSADTSNAADPSAVDTAADETEDPFVKDDLPADMDYDEATMTVLCWEGWDKNEFFVEEDTGEIVDSAVYTRNLAVEERMNITLNWDQVPHGETYSGSWRRKLSQAVTAGDTVYDLGASYASHPAGAAIAGELMNINEVENVDLGKPWYYESATKAGTFGDHLYLIAGDHSYNALARMSGVFFNVDLITNLNMEDPYELVLANEWTVDKFGEVLTGTWQDTNGNGEKDYYEDIFGMICAHDQLQTTYYSAGNVWCDLDENNLPRISDDVYGEKITTLIDKWIAIYNDSAIEGKGDSEDPSVFSEGRTIFYIYPLGHVQDSILRESDVTYGFVPQPKYDETQEHYIASVTNAVTMWGIPLIVEDPARSGALMECLGSEGYRTVTPAVFEQAFGAKYNSDSSGRQTQIFDELRENIHFDLGKVFSNDLFQGIPNSAYANAIWNGKNNYTSQMQSYKRAINRGLTNLLKDLGYTE